MNEPTRPPWAGDFEPHAGWQQGEVPQPPPGPTNDPRMERPTMHAAPQYMTNAVMAPDPRRMIEEAIRRHKRKIHQLQALSDSLPAVLSGPAADALIDLLLPSVLK